MITVGEKTIKLQIWDTVLLLLNRLARNPSSPSPADTTVRLREPSSSTISPTESLSPTYRDHDCDEEHEERERSEDVISGEDVSCHSGGGLVEGVGFDAWQQHQDERDE
ncbi:unnamed protein product [Sphagnum balticum]